ncbi:hypothetical protein PINS_up015952 [Pythium insidiosum]|nr:hypothetical protein PINS_up015952 [Pythium insidiosum]
MSFAFGGGGGGGFGAAPTGGAGAFGATSAFGAANKPATPGFGGFGGGAATTGGFGAAPAATGGTGLFGGGAATGGATAFGGGAASPTTGFGGAAAPTSGFGGGGFGAGAATSAFGAKPATAGAASSPFGQSSLFGGASTQSAFGAPSTGGFGSTASTGGFGTPAPAASTGGLFGGGGGAFGAKPAATGPFGAAATTGASAFGGGAATTGAFGAGGAATGAFGAAAPAQPQVGTGNPPYQPHRDTDAGGPVHYLSISRMQAYSHKSAEELRFEDYLKRTNPAAAAQQAAMYPATAAAPAGAGATGAAGGFGGFGAGATTGGFGAAGTTGTQGAFGAANGFGATPTASTGGFGGGFTTGGASTPGAGGGLFGSTTRSAGGFGAVSQPMGANTFGGGGGFGATATGFGGAAATPAPAFGSTGGFGAMQQQQQQPQAGGFGGFGAGATTGGFGTAATTGGFGKPAAASGGFGFGGATTTATPAAGGFGGFGTGAQTGAAGGSSLFGGGGAAAGVSSFGFGSAAKPPASGGFGGFGATAPGTATTATGGFGTGGGFGAAAAAPATGGLFGGGATAGQTGGGLFGGGATAAAPATSTGGFGFGGGTTLGSATPATAGGGLFGGAAGGFGAAKPAGTSLFGGASTASTGTTSLFGSMGSTGTATTGAGTGGSLFGNTGTATKSLGFGTGGFGFGGGATGSAGFGATTTTAPKATGFGGFGSLGSATSAAPSTGFSFGGGAASSFAPSALGAAAPATAAAGAAPANASLVAAPDVNPYGTGSFGAGLVEQNVKAALDLPSLKASSSASAARLSSFAQDVGLPRGAMESSVTTRRHLLSNRYSIPVSFIRGSSFKGTKNRLASITSSKSNATQLGSSPGVRFGGSAGNATADDEFKFSSTLFRNSVAKRLVIDKDGAQGTSTASARVRALPPRASVVPLGDDDAVRDSSAGIANGSQRALLKPEDEDGLYRVVFRNMATNKSFTLRLKGNERVQDAREEVKRLLHATNDKDDGGKGTRDVELLVHGRIVADTLTIDALRLRDGDSIDVALVEDLTGAEVTSKSKDVSAQSSTAASASAPASRFVSYAEFMSSAMRETEAEAASAHAKPVSAACPSLKNEDYFTVPSYDRLKRMTEQELAQVEGFKVGCKGLGTVEWLGKTDVRHLDLDELIQFEKKEVIVYKDDDNKHPLGTGLNRPAIVELLGVFPPRKTQDPEQYRERVQQRTVDIGATFIDYSPSKGIWRFRVEHFSRYGFDDDDDDEDDVDMETSKNNDLQLQHAKVAAAMTAQKKKMAMPPSSAKLSKHITANDPRVGLLRNSLMYGDRSVGHNASVASFRQDGSALPLTANGGHQEDDDEMTDANVQSNAQEQEEEDEASEPIVQMQKSVVFPMTTSSAAILPLGIDSETSRLPRDATSTTYQIYLQATQQQQRQITTTTTPTAKSHVDMGLFMARSFRCSWGPNGELVNIGKLVTSRPRDQSQQLGRRVAIEMPLEVAGTQRKALTTELLDMHFQCCEASPFEGDCTDAAPLYALPSTNDGVVHCLHEYVAFAERVRQQFPSSRRFRRWALLWKLVHALWGQEHDQRAGGATQRACPLAARDDPREIESMESLPMVDLRREAISRWFEDALSAEWAKATAADSDEPSQARVLQLLCQHRIVEAAEAAMACGDLRLSTMIAQTATYEGSDFRTLVADQLAQWTENGTLEFMEEDVVMVYSLLAGSVEVVTAQRAKDLTWLMCLALFFWYKRGPAVSLKVALRLYREAVDKQLASAPVATTKPSTTPHKLDMLMEVMKLYVDDAVSLCSVLSPSGLKGDEWRDGGDRPELHLDYELSWHLHSVLRAVGYKIDRKWESHVHQNFVRQLDGAGQWKEAVYVALNISDATERAASCRELLVRNTDLLAATQDARRVLAERYLVPQPWIEEALAVGAVNQHEYRQEIAHWIAAQRFEEAHACLVRHVAPSCLFSGERTVLLQLLEELELFADQISQWSAAHIDACGLVGGGLWLEYLRLEQQHGLQMGREAEFLARLLHLAERLTSSSSASSSATAALTTTERERLVARTALSSMLVTLSTQAIKIRSLLDAEPVEQEELPAQLEPAFLSSLAQLSRGRETKFVETYRAQHVHALCSAFVDWRA